MLDKGISIGLLSLLFLSAILGITSCGGGNTVGIGDILTYQSKYVDKEVTVEGYVSVLPTGSTFMIRDDTGVAMARYEQGKLPENNKRIVARAIFRLSPPGFEIKSWQYTK